MNQTRRSWWDAVSRYAPDPWYVPRFFKNKKRTTSALRKEKATSKLGRRNWDAACIWLDAAGRVTKKQNEFGGITTYKYDAAGNLIEEDLPPVQGNGRNPRVVKYRYDAAGRLRATIQEGAQPVFTATDYFLPGASPANFVRHGRMDSAPLDVVEEEKGSGVFISPSLGFPGGNRQGVHFGVMAQL